jgi:hypothetical protein
MTDLATYYMDRYLDLRKHHDEFVEETMAYLKLSGKQHGNHLYALSILETLVRDLHAQLRALEAESGPLSSKMQTTLRLVMFSLDKLVDAPEWTYTEEQDAPIEGATRRVYTFDNGYQASVILGIAPAGFSGNMAPDIWEIAVLHDRKIVKTHLSHHDTVFRVFADELDDALRQISELPPR